MTSKYRPHKRRQKNKRPREAPKKEPKPEDPRTVDLLIQHRWRRIAAQMWTLRRFSDERLKTLLRMFWKQMASDNVRVAHLAQLFFHATEELLISRHVHGSRSDADNDDAEVEIRNAWEDKLPINMESLHDAAIQAGGWFWAGRPTRQSRWVWDDLAFPGPVIRSLYGPTVTRFDGSGFRDPASKRHFPEIDMLATL